jgi:hypothetical protein
MSYFNRTVVSLFLLSMIALPLSSQAEEIFIASEDFTVENVEWILWNSSILDLFWYGDDGVDCGDPTLSDLTIDKSQKLISFIVDPMALAWSCEMNSMQCEVSYNLNADQSVSFTDSYVHPYGGGCTYL